MVYNGGMTTTTERMAILRERAEQRLYGLGVLNMNYPEHRLEAVDTVIAALGLGDLDAVVERGAAALAREQYPAQTWPDDFEVPDNLRADAEACLAGALTPGEPA